MDGYHAVQTPSGKVGCEPIRQPPIECASCRGDQNKDGGGTPNPIALYMQEKYRWETDWEGHGPAALSIARIYRSNRGFEADKGSARVGLSWTHSHHWRLKTAPKDDGEKAQIITPEGYSRLFSRAWSESEWTPINSTDKLVGQNGLFLYSSADDNEILKFDSSGKLIERALLHGWKYSYYYEGDRLVSVRNNFGDSMFFIYTGEQLTEVKVPGNLSIFYAYDGIGHLVGVVYPDGKSRHFLYENPGFSHALTGIIDETGTRWGTFGYDVKGRAISSELAGGVGRYQVSYPSAAAAVVTDPLNTVRSYTYAVAKDRLIVTSGSLPSGEGKPDAYSRNYDQYGRVTSEDDFKGARTNVVWDTTRRLPASVTQAAGRPDERTTNTTWHSQWRLPLTVTEAGRTTTYTYDGLGNRLSQSISGTGASAGSPAHTTSWTYHPSGLVATETAPDGGVTSFQYSSAGHLTSTTNALGHTDTYTHDAAGRVLTHTAPTGLVTSYTYDLRGRLLTAQVGGLTSTFTYRPSGQIVTATLPSGHVTTYTYDAAQRLTGWSDNRGQSGVYTLDAMGNRIQEAVHNTQGNTAWQLVRSINNINRTQSVTVGGQQTTSYGYDANGEGSSATNGLNQSTQLGLDSLRRVKTITNPENATASLTYNALDATTQASDFKGVPTTYTRDALGNATSESSPDTGTETAQYDALGLAATITDALGQTTSIERDRLGRPTLVTYADGRTTTLRYDLTPTSKGYLSEIVDASGTTTYQRDSHGRVTTKTQTLINGDTRSVSYGYNAQGLLASTTYPGGQVLQYVYDSTGLLSGLTWAGQSLVSGITWNPLGQPTGWSWNLPGGGTAIPASRTYNTAGQLTDTEFSSYQYDAAGRIHTLIQHLWQPASTTAQDSTVTQVARAWTVQYSPAGRITGFTKNTGANTPADSASFQYDANGNRTASTRDVAGTTTSRTYSGDAAHNRLLGFAQTTSQGGNTATSNVTYQYNNAGDLLGDGLISYQYDSEGRMESATTGQGADAPQTKYAHNGLGQRVFKTEPLYSSAAAKPASTKTLANLLADDDENDGKNGQEPPGFIEQLKAFLSKLWSPATSDAEKLGWSYVYGEDGTLLGEYGSGGANSAGTAQYLYLPTASGPMPIAAVIKGQTYAIHSDHLNTPRKLTQADGQAAWQWEYSAFGDEQPTTAAKRFTSETTTPTTGSTSVPEVTFNLRYPGQYFDAETKLHYNYFRSYDSRTGRYTQGDPIGLDGGWNRFSYVGGDPLGLVDPYGLDPSILPRRSYDANDVRGGFDIGGRSLVYNPKHYDPAKASQVLLTGAILVAPEFLAAGRAACTAAETISLYRAVGPEEFYSLINGGRFAFGPNGATMKQFGFKLDETLKYANWSTDYAAIIRADIPRSALKDLSVSFGQIDAYIFRNGVVTVEGQRALDALNRAVITIKHAY
ncbi:RHS repeat-associated core domain-containing protein [Acidovorax sp. sic0104]|uniref:RHS repeat-associated core domain-containing protein n=2 Tax=Acidovorax sp. sic0104 TaxID=2854784 RepID=UPI00210751C2|nr:RHS repeat-associated core domain-containing protein [Acidovorax sp. sic0104]